MKKRIIAFILAFVVSSAALSEAYRPARAELTVATVATLGILAWQLIGVMTGQYDDAANAIGVFIESGVDGITNSDSPFQQNWRTGWEQIRSTLSSWFEAGEISIDSDGKVHMNYQQYLELLNQCVGLVAKPDVSFEAGYNYYFLSGDLGKPFSPVNFPLISEFYSDTVNGQGYAPVYYSSERLVFASSFFTIRNYSTDKHDLILRKFTSSTKWANVQGLAGQSGTIQDICKERYITFTFSLDSCSISYRNASGTSYSYDSALDHCFVYENGTLSYVPISDVNVSGMNSGIITTTGNFPSFLNSLNGYNIADNPVNLDDLSDLIPDDTNPDIVIDTNPDIPIPDAVIIDDVPISDIIKTDIDLDIPSIIVDKFPFCIPFDFMRIISVLAAEPKDPVIHIPISTNNDYINDFILNETVNDYYIIYEQPMFEIDEEIVLDLSEIPLLQPISYTIFIIGFVVLLIMITPKMINH